MVRTDNDIDNMPPIERLKFLRQKERERAQEIDELEQKKKEELDSISSELSETFKEIAEDEEKLFREEEEKKKIEELRKTKSLEETVEGEKVQRAPIPQGSNTYISNALVNPGSPINFYDVTNRDFYNRVKDIVDRADAGYISDEEKQFLSNVAYHVDRFRREDMYKRKDDRDYLSRTSALLDRFDV